MKTLRRLIILAVLIVVVGAVILYQRGAIDISLFRPRAAEPDVEVVLGPPQVVFDYSIHRCDTYNFPDLPVRAFRDSLGAVHMTMSDGSVPGSSEGANYNWKGASLTSLRRDCNPLYRSARDPDFSDFKAYEWISSTYTEDGRTVYALVHDEWYCDPNDPGKGGTRAVTLLKSTNGGVTFTTPADYKVLVPAESWNYQCSNATNYVYGYQQPSSILKSGGYYYALVGHITPPNPSGRQIGGTVLIRTNNLDSAASWEVWTGSGWDTSLIGPGAYVLPAPLGAFSLTYNTYLGKYLVVGDVFNVLQPGIYFSTSDDLIHWSDPQPIVTDTSIEEMLRNHHYGTILDPSDAARNFEQTDQEVFFYFLRDNTGTAVIDRDLIRQTLRFEIVGEQSPTPTPTGTSTVSPRPGVTKPPQGTNTPTPLPTRTPKPGGIFDRIFQ